MTTNCKACWDSTTGRCLKHRAYPVVLALAALGLELDDKRAEWVDDGVSVTF